MTEHCAFCGIPPEPMVPAHKLRQAETRHLNLLLDLGRLINGEEPICGFSEVEQLREMLRANDGVEARDADTNCHQPPMPDGADR